MKKKLLIAASISCFFAAKSQLTYVGDAALLHIEDQALFYSGGGVKLDGSAKVNTIGDVMVVTSSDNFEVASTSDFRLKYVSSSVYGQLYLEGVPQANITGNVNKEYVNAIHGTTGRQQTALPFKDYTPANLLATLPQINLSNTSLNYVGRFNKRSVFKWNNAEAVFDQITTDLTTVGKPTDYYILSRLNYDGTYAWDPTITAENDLASTDNIAGTSSTATATAINTKKKIFKGLPVSDTGADTAVTLFGAFAGSFGANGTGYNKYKEIYNTYIDDPFVTNKWIGDYGLNMYQYGNPFLTNIDLSLVKKGTTTSDDENAIANINGIAYYVSGITESKAGTAHTQSGAVVKTFDTDGNVVGGVSSDLIIKPMQAFMVKLTDGTSQALKFNKTRRFAQTARADTTPYSVTAARMASSKIVTKQLGIMLLNSNDEEIGRTFYVVNTDAVTGYSPGNARMQATNDNASIYTKEELLTGGADDSTSYGLFINEANEVDFKGKQIPLVVNDANAAKLKFFLIEGGKLLSDNSSLTNGKSFYFNNNGTLTKLNSGTTIPIENNTYGLFYEQPNGNLGTNELTNGQTFVAKNGTDYVVRFNKNWKTADIEIYSAIGQLIYSVKKVSTYNDFTLPLNSSVNSVYLVKVKSDNGETVTKKVIK